MANFPANEKIDVECSEAHDLGELLDELNKDEPTAADWNEAADYFFDSDEL